MLTIDFETRSNAEIKTGPHRYAEDPTTEVMCLSWSYEEDDLWLWHPAFPNVGIEERVLYQEAPDAPLERVKTQHAEYRIMDLHKAISDGMMVEAHNAMFEQCVWEEIMVKVFGWPRVPLRQWRCSAAMAASLSLPRSLDGAISALNLPFEKDMEGNRLMKRMCKPRIPLKADRELVAQALGLANWKDVPKPQGSNLFDLRAWLRDQNPDVYDDLVTIGGELHPWHEKPEELERLFVYNGNDVYAEKGLSAQLRPLSDYEQEVWFLDQKMNHAGIYCDLPLVERALEITEQVVEGANFQVASLSEGAVTKVSQRGKLFDWVNAQQKTQLPDMTKATLEEAIGFPERFDPKAYEAIKLRLMASKTSTKKYATMLASACSDSRIRDLLAYWGADTGRWAGRGVQPQNFPRGDAKNRMKIVMEDDGSYSAKKWFDMGVGCDDIMHYDRGGLDLMYGEAMELLSTALRGAMTAAPGNELVAADYSAIEARGVFWLAGDDTALDVFERGEDIYLDMCAGIYERPYESFTKEDAERQIGKFAVLGLGYQMAEKKFQAQCEQAGVHLDLAFCLRVKNAYRSLHSPVKDLWGNLEKAAVDAIKNGPGAKPVECGPIKFAVRNSFLYMVLPSGRLLAYHAPSVKLETKTIEVPMLDVDPATGVETLYYVEKETEKWSIRYMGMNSQTRQWCRQSTYGGKLTENAVQALSRDLMADAMLRLDKTGLYRPILTVHDEVVCEVPWGKGSVEELEEIMSIIPAWAQGFPLAAEGWRGVRYRK